MKRLFEVVGTFFDNKEDAKAVRDEFNMGPHDPKHPAKVSLGPDHFRYGLRGNPRTHSHNAKSGGPGNGFPNKK